MVIIMRKSKIIPMSYSSHNPNREQLDVFLKIQSEPTIVRLTADDEKQCVSLSNRGGSIGRYPWRDPSYKIGDSFFKPMSKEEVDQDKGRPGQPPSVRDEGIIWRSKRVYHKGKKQYGYRVTRIA
jgi:hypothetical protein